MFYLTEFKRKCYDSHFYTIEYLNLGVKPDTVARQQIGNLKAINSVLWEI